MARVYPWNYPGVPVPRKHLRGMGEPQQYSEYTSGGSSIPSGPYAPPPTVVMMPNNVPPPLGPLTHVNITPITPVFVPPAPDIVIRRVPSVNVNTRLPGPLAPSVPTFPDSTWNSFRQRVSAIPWRGDKPEQGASSVDVLNTLQRRSNAGDPDAAEAAKGFVERLERQDAEWQARRQQELNTYAEVGRSYRASQESKIISAAQKKYPDAIITRTIEEYRAAVAANPGKKVVKLPEDSFSGNLTVSLATTFAPKVASAGGERVSDVAAQATSDLGAGIRNGVDALSTWIGLKTNPIKERAASQTKSLYQEAKDLVLPIASQYIGKSAVLGFGSYFDKFINAPVPSDPGKARSWANSVFVTLIKYAMRPSGKEDDPTAKAIKSEITGRWEGRLRADLAEAASTQGDATRDNVDAALRVQNDLRLMRKDIEDTTAREVQKKLEDQDTNPVLPEHESAHRGYQGLKRPAPPAAPSPDATAPVSSQDLRAATRAIQNLRRVESSEGLQTGTYSSDPAQVAHEAGITIEQARAVLSKRR